MTVANGISMEYGQWISFTEVRFVPLDIDYFWSMYDDCFAFLSSLSGRTDVRKELGFGKPDNSPGAVVSFNFEGMRVYDRLVMNDRVNHVWKLDIPQATELFTLYQVTVTAKKADNGTDVTNFLEFVLRSEKLEERQAALSLLQKYAKLRPSELLDFLKNRDGDQYHELPQSK
ncbi:hypothetical protein [Phormidesmis priestleyi]|uniref:hypothetical protein n=1 Tax=Phormidesmis priestleyi TaxID=268141 RepID=UPI00083AA7A2|nr:hypothetical protein [Phormidesmis priestleyi]